MLRSWQFVQTVLGILFRHPVTGTTIIPVLPDGKIVLIRRRDTGQWGLPGGIVNWGEDVPTTVERELEEETGLKLVKICRLVGVYSAPDRDPRVHSISIVVEVEAQGTMQAQDTLEVSEVRAFDLSSLPKGQLSHDHDRQLQDYLDGSITLA
ncbi:NUDIX hydrolase [Planktothrix sp. FACHB-1355]|uniref:NUDIX hydrolase n=1 Tax=Aerosakkonema funiforme FACHB-1375 TaxID=2949571 RepID=A0A926VE10_9CYAN|nr:MULTISPECIES: NUDIX hydrolase [Oscillatoriales]MBD2182216.1 NUDIX hydrolase [Aerosakkonema funiforme FACHB-1375]MBD3558890.1 NUDIX hydrolase [Planktothrix sp. FACHB-1355]